MKIEHWIMNVWFFFITNTNYLQIEKKKKKSKFVNRTLQYYDIKTPPRSISTKQIQTRQSLKRLKIDNKETLT